MIPEVACTVCRARQSPWNYRDGDVGPCRYCGAPLPRPPVTDLLPGAISTETAISAALQAHVMTGSSLPKEAETAICSEPAPRESRVTTAPQSVQEPGIEDALPGRYFGRLGSQEKDCWRNSLVILLLLSIATCAASHGVPYHLTYLHNSYWPKPLDAYDYQGYVEAVAMAAGVVVLMISMALLIVIWRRPDFCFIVMVVLGLGILTYCVGFYAGAFLAESVDWKPVYGWPRPIR